MFCTPDKCKNNKGVNATTMLFLGAYGDKSAGCDHRKKIGNNQYIVARSGNDFYPDKPDWKKLLDALLHNYCCLGDRCEEITHKKIKKGR